MMNLQGLGPRMPTPAMMDEDFMIGAPMRGLGMAGPFAGPTFFEEEFEEPFSPLHGLLGDLEDYFYDDYDPFFSEERFSPWDFAGPAFFEDEFEEFPFPLGAMPIDRPMPLAGRPMPPFPASGPGFDMNTASKPFPRLSMPPLATPGPAFDMAPAPMPFSSPAMPALDMQVPTGAPFARSFPTYDFIEEETLAPFAFEPLANPMMAPEFAPVSADPFAMPFADFSVSPMVVPA